VNAPDLSLLSGVIGLGSVSKQSQQNLCIYQESQIIFCFLF
jgi:hypothetical protein